MRTGFGRNKVPHPFPLPSTTPAAPQPCLTSIPTVQYSLICHVLNANFNVLPPHMPPKGESRPQRCSGCCPILSWINTGAICRLADTEMFVFQGDSTSLPSLQLTPCLSNAEGKRDLTTATSLRDPPRAPPLKLPQLAEIVSPRVVIWSCERADVKNKAGKNCVKLSRTFY